MQNIFLITDDEVRLIHNDLILMEENQDRYINLRNALLELISIKVYLNKELFSFDKFFNLSDFLSKDQFSLLEIEDIKLCITERKDKLFTLIENSHLNSDFISFNSYLSIFNDTIILEKSIYRNSNIVVLKSLEDIAQRNNIYYLNIIEEVIKKEINREVSNLLLSIIPNKLFIEDTFINSLSSPLKDGDILSILDDIHPKGLNAIEYINNNISKSINKKVTDLLYLFKDTKDNDLMLIPKNKDNLLSKVTDNLDDWINDAIYCGSKNKHSKILSILQMKDIFSLHSKLQEKISEYEKTIGDITNDLYWVFEKQNINTFIVELLNKEDSKNPKRIEFSRLTIGKFKSMSYHGKDYFLSHLAFKKDLNSPAHWIDSFREIDVLESLKVSYNDKEIYRIPKEILIKLENITEEIKQLYNNYKNF